MHGCQFVDPAKRALADLLLRRIERRRPGHPLPSEIGAVRVGAIGLGVGTLAAYARPGDVFRFYEINPEVVRMARQYFTYLADCRGRCDVVLGDARLSLESASRRRSSIFWCSTPSAATRFRRTC